MRLFQLSSLLLLAETCLASASAYKGAQVVRVKMDDNRSVVDGIINRLRLETWAPPSKGGSFADIVVPAALSKAFTAETAQMDTRVLHKDLAESVARTSELAPMAAGDKWFDNYHSYADHIQFLQDLNAKYPGKTRLVRSGTSLEGRNITGLRIFSGKPGRKPAVIWHGTVHAREWITTMVVEYLGYQLLTDSASSAFLKKYDFIILPVVNPDGFVYSQTNERLWRKNRRPGSLPLSLCSGVDLNRNWPYQWDVEGGSSTSPCNQAYRGPSEGSEPETKGISGFLRRIKRRQGLQMYIDWHSYSQLFMTPYGYTCDKVPANNATLVGLSQGFADSLRSVHGTEFRVGPICPTIYQVAGDSVDYAFDVVGVPYVFTAELRDTGENGFLLPPEQIRPSGEEAWAGMKTLLMNMK